jgi:hypothetical protein
MHFSTYDVPQSKPSVPLGNMSIFYGEELLRPYPKPEAVGPSLVGRPRLIIAYIHSYTPSSPAASP